MYVTLEEFMKASMLKRSIMLTSMTPTELNDFILEVASKSVDDPALKSLLVFLKKLNRKVNDNDIMRKMDSSIHYEFSHKIGIPFPKKRY